MKSVEFEIPRNCDLTNAERVIEQVCKRRGLQTTMKGSLATYPGSTHWHYKKCKAKGTLELTLYIPGKRIWGQVQKGRQAPWVGPELVHIRRAIEHALQSACKD